VSQPSTGEKTEQPTPKRLRDARLKGQVARSQEMVTTISLIALIVCLWFNWSAMYGRLIMLFDRVAAYAADDFGHHSAAALYEAAWAFGMLLLPILVVVILAGLLANFVQVGALMSVEAIKPKGERINPGAGARRIFSRKQAVELLKTSLKIVILTSLLYVVIRNAINPYVSSLECGLRCQASITISVLGQIIVYTALAFIAVAVADFAYQRRAHLKSLMMTRDEVKREYKEMEGDPLIKGKRRQIAQEMAMEDRGQAAQRATAIIINPTHLAVAIYYSVEKAPVPTVTAKGRNREAHLMMGLAEEAGVPIFRNITLARALYADAELMQPIPEEMFDAVAEVLAWVADHKDSLYTGRLAHGVIDMDDLRRKREQDSS
jgi:type III secretion protein U